MLMHKIKFKKHILKEFETILGFQTCTQKYENIKITDLIGALSFRFIAHSHYSQHQIYQVK